MDIEVNKKTGKILVKHVYGAQDAGLTVNPNLVENQMMGAMVQGVSRALFEELAFNKNQVTSLDWVSYPIMRFKEPKLRFSCRRSGPETGPISFLRMSLQSQCRDPQS